MQRLADDLVGDMGAVEVAGVDVIDPARHRLAEHRDRLAPILRGPEHPRSGELHGAVAEPPYGASAQLEGSGFAEIGHGMLPSRADIAEAAVARRDGPPGEMVDAVGIEPTTPPV